MRKHAQPSIKPLKDKQWFNFYLVLAVLSLIEMALLLSENPPSQILFFITIIISGAVSLALLILGWGQAVYGSSYFSNQTKGIWPSHYTAITILCLAVCGIVPSQLGDPNAQVTPIIILFMLFGIGAIASTVLDHRQLEGR